MPGHARPAVEIHEIELLGQLDVVARRKVEVADRRSAAAQLGGGRLAADRGQRVRQVGDGRVQLVQLYGQRIDRLLGRVFLFAQPAAFFLARLALGRIFGLSDRLGNLVGPAVQVLDLGVFGPALGLQRDEAVDIDLGAAAGAVLFDRGGLIENELAIQHDVYPFVQRFRANLHFALCTLHFALCILHSTRALDSPQSADQCKMQSEKCKMQNEDEGLVVGRSAVRLVKSSGPMGWPNSIIAGSTFQPLNRRACMPKEKDTVEVDGVVTQALANTRFRVTIDGGHEVIAHVAGRMRKNFIRIVPGDKVKVELSPYDLTKGRITYRER